MLVWFLWPGATWQFEPEAFFAFGVAVVVWAFTEFKLSEEVIWTCHAFVPLQVLV